MLDVKTKHMRRMEKVEVRFILQESGYRMTYHERGVDITGLEIVTNTAKRMTRSFEKYA
jgi:hypothetical protein